MRTLGLILLTAVAQDPKSGASDGSLKHAERDRTYRLYLPKSFKGEPVPLVVALHGMGSNGAQTERLTGFDKLADDKGFAVVYPDGLDKVWRYTEILDRKEVDDLGFIVALVDRLIKDKVADPKRVYATGISNGAYMSNMLAARHADRFAAIAPVAGTMLRPAAEKLKPSRPVPVLYFHGTEDGVVGYDGADRFSRRKLSLSAEELAAWWADKNGCDAAGTPKIDKPADKDPEDGTTVQKYSYGKSKDGAEVVFFRIENGGHVWPGGPKLQEVVLGKVTREIDASALIWEFFSRFSLP